MKLQPVSPLYFVFATQESDKVWPSVFENSSECEYCKMSKKTTIKSACPLICCVFFFFCLTLYINNVNGRKFK